GMDPVKVLRLAAAMGGQVERLLVVGCEPAPLAEAEDVRLGMSAPVRAAVEEAVSLVKSLVARLLRGETAAVRWERVRSAKEVQACQDCRLNPRPIGPRPRARSGADSPPRDGRPRGGSLPAGS